eukprot:TRINITY_DN18464_c0_g1_i1.p1 TRINITY_DN18464_c0_g1~~TRINITY_DN18464_c0_g1_i1.p1  ORF type:complete len:1295 (-),score=244.57 TRINITY_DN18464_c0_g1_i1:54-3938(-)
MVQAAATAPGWTPRPPPGCRAALKAARRVYAACSRPTPPAEPSPEVHGHGLSDSARAEVADFPDPSDQTCGEYHADLEEDQPLSSALGQGGDLFLGCRMMPGGVRLFFKKQTVPDIIEVPAFVSSRSNKDYEKHGLQGQGGGRLWYGEAEKDALYPAVEVQETDEEIAEDEEDDDVEEGDIEKLLRQSSQAEAQEVPVCTDHADVFAQVGCPQWGWRQGFSPCPAFTERPPRPTNRPGGASRRRPAAQQCSGAAPNDSGCHLSYVSWPHGSRRKPTRPHSARYCHETERKAHFSKARPTSAQPASARPASARPASARPASARPASARPTAARPTSARPTSARPTSRPSSGSAQLASSLATTTLDLVAGTRPASASRLSEITSHQPRRPASALARLGENSGVSILMQQQEQLNQDSDSMLMQNWLSSYKNSRARARMACRPLWGEGSEITAVCPEKPKQQRQSKRQHDIKKMYYEDDQQEGEVEILADASDWEDEFAAQARCEMKASTLEAATPEAIIPEALTPETTSPKATSVKAVSPKKNHITWISPISETDEQPDQRGDLVPGLRMSAIGEDAEVMGMVMSSTKSTASETRSEHDPDQVLTSVFQRHADDGEVHRDNLLAALELTGVRSPIQQWVDDIMSEMTKYNTLSEDEFIRFVKLYRDYQSREYDAAFHEYDIDGSGTIEAEELAALLESLGITPMKHVLKEIIDEVDIDNTGELDLDEFCSVLALLGERDGFGKAEYQRLRHAFLIYDADDTGDLETDELMAILGYLAYSMSEEDVSSLVDEVDIDGSGSLNMTEFFIFMRKVREQEIGRLVKELERLYAEDKTASKLEILLQLMRCLGYMADVGAVRDAAEDSGRILSEMIDRSSSDVVTLTDAYCFLELYRSREGFTRAEAAELEETFDEFAEVGDAPHCDQLPRRIKALEAGRAVRYLGYPASHEANELMFSEVSTGNDGMLSKQEFLKLVRKYREKEIEEIQAHILQFGPAYLANELSDSLNQRLRWRENLALPPSEDDIYQLVSAALKARAKVRHEMRANMGFSRAEETKFRETFDFYDSDMSGSVASSELRAVCEDLMPDMASDPSARPELIRLMTEVDSSGEGNLDFREFLQLMRKLLDSKMVAKAHKENRLLSSDLGFTKHQIRDFRELFVANDPEGNDILTFRKVKQLIHNIVPLGERRIKQLSQMWQKIAETDTTKEEDEWPIDFPDFLRLMNALLSTDWCGIHARSEAVVNAGEEAKKRSRRRRTRPPPPDNSESIQRLVDNRRSVIQVSGEMLREVHAELLKANG